MKNLKSLLRMQISRRNRSLISRMMRKKTSLSVENYIDQKIDEMNANLDKKDQISDKVKKYAKGEGGLTLEEMSAKDLEQLDSVASGIQSNGSSNLEVYLNSTFEVGDKNEEK